MSDTLEPWLEGKKTVCQQIEGHGFRLEFFRRCWLRHYGRFSRDLLTSRS